MIYGYIFVFEHLFLGFCWFDCLKHRYGKGRLIGEGTHGVE